MRIGGITRVFAIVCMAKSDEGFKACRDVEILLLKKKNDERSCIDTKERKKRPTLYLLARPGISC